jgi:LPXTG-motif cell wall-anchored protein
MWWQNNWYWVAGGVLVLGAISFVAYKKIKK